MTRILYLLFILGANASPFNFWKTMYGKPNSKESQSDLEYYSPGKLLEPSYLGERHTFSPLEWFKAFSIERPKTREVDIFSAFDNYGPEAYGVYAPQNNHQQKLNNNKPHHYGEEGSGQRWPGPDGRGPWGPGPDGRGPWGPGPDGRGPWGPGPDGRGPGPESPIIGEVMFKIEPLSWQQHPNGLRGSRDNQNGANDVLPDIPAVIHRGVKQLTETLVCICQEVVRTHGTQGSESDDPLNPCAMKYCHLAAQDPKIMNCTDPRYRDPKRPGLLEECVLRWDKNCYLYFPDPSDNGKTMAYFEAISKCMQHAPVPTPTLEPPTPESASIPPQSF